MYQSKNIIIVFFILVFIGSLLFFVLKRFASHDKVDNFPISNDYIPVTDTTNKEGKVSFMLRCASCHTIFKDLTGPALQGVQERWKNNKQLIQYIRNWTKIPRNNPNVIRLRKKYVTEMTIFEGLSDKECQLILDYIAFEERKKGISIPSSTR